MNKHIHSVLILVSLSLIAFSCKKDTSLKPIKPTSRPIPIVDSTSTVDSTPKPPKGYTSKLKGSYVWHGIKEIQGTIENTCGNLTIYTTGEYCLYYDKDYRETPMYYYPYSFNDSELIYSRKDHSDTFIFNYVKSKLLRKYHYNTYTGLPVNETQYFTFPQQNMKWKDIWQPKTTEIRRWEYTRNYYLNYTINGDTTVETEIEGAAITLGASTFAHTWFIAADSVCMFYRETQYDAGPNTLNVVGAIKYNAVDNRFYIYNRAYGPYSSTHIYETID